MKKLLTLVLVCMIVLLCEGCQTTFGITFDGEKWGIEFGGEVPQIPLIDYENEID